MRPARLSCAVLAVLALAGCSSAHPDVATTGANSTKPAAFDAVLPGPTGNTVGAVSLSTSRNAGARQLPTTSCPSSGVRPDRWVRAPIDVDGDGTSDRFGYSGDAHSIVVKLSSGGSAAAKYPTASPYLAVLGVDADSRHSDDELLVVSRGAIGNDGVVGQNAVFFNLVDCHLRLAPNIQGHPYTFEIGAAPGHRYGVGCVDGRLVGLTSTWDRTGWDVVRIPVRLEDGTARNGEAQHLQIAAGTKAARLLGVAVCRNDFPVSLG